MLEKKLQSKILAHIKATPYCWPVKVTVANRNGTPDILACYRGRFVALEVKTPSGRPTLLQEAQLDAIRDAGGVAAVVRSVDDVKTVLEGVL
jgi:hypothetical protein